MSGMTHEQAMAASLVRTAQRKIVAIGRMLRDNPGYRLSEVESRELIEHLRVYSPGEGRHRYREVARNREWLMGLADAEDAEVQRIRDAEEMLSHQKVVENEDGSTTYYASDPDPEADQAE